MLIRFLASAAALAVATWLLPGIRLGGTDDVWGQVFTLLAVAAIFGFVNALIKPLFKFVSAPLILLTLGLFLLVINAAMLMLTSWLAGRLDLAFHVEGFGSALLGGIVVTIVTMILNAVIPDAKR